MVNFDFASNRKISFGRDKTLTLPDTLEKTLGSSDQPVLLISGKAVTKTELWDRLLSDMKNRGISTLHTIVTGEPSPETVDRICENFGPEHPAAVVGLGGGSVLDAGKAVAAMLVEKAPVEQFLEGVGTRDPGGETRPFIALPTTAGTGSECTKNAVISRPGRDGFKKSLRHDNYIPSLAIVDPRWLEGLPREIAASCGMDAFSQLLESYLSTGASPLTDVLALKGLEGFFRSFDALLEGNPLENDLEEISLGASLSGLTLANAGLGTVHGLAGVIGGLSEIPHGTACGLLLPVVMEETLYNLLENEPENPAVAKAAGLGRLIAKDNSAKTGEAVENLLRKLRKWQESAALPGLSALGLDDELMSKAAAESGNKNNPYAFDEKQRLALLKRIC